MFSMKIGADRVVFSNSLAIGETFGRCFTKDWAVTIGTCRNSHQENHKSSVRGDVNTSSETHSLYLRTGSESNTLWSLRPLKDIESGTGTSLTREVASQPVN